MQKECCIIFVLLICITNCETPESFVIGNWTFNIENCDYSQENSVDGTWEAIITSCTSNVDAKYSGTWEILDLSGVSDSWVRFNQTVPLTSEIVDCSFILRGVKKMDCQTSISGTFYEMKK